MGILSDLSGLLGLGRPAETQQLQPLRPALRPAPQSLAAALQQQRAAMSVPRLSAFTTQIFGGLGSAGTASWGQQPIIDTKERNLARSLCDLFLKLHEELEESKWLIVETLRESRYHLTSEQFNSMEHWWVLQDLQPKKEEE